MRGDADGSGCCQVESCWWYLDDRELSRAHVAQESHNPIVETCGSLFPREFKVLHEPVQNVDGVGVSSWYQAQESHGLSVTQEN